LITLDYRREEQSANYTDGMAFHWYSKKDDFDHVQAVYDAYPGKLLLATEATEVLDTARPPERTKHARAHHSAISLPHRCSTRRTSS
jgi:O-glycosyl hydrolase